MAFTLPIYEVDTLAKPMRLFTFFSLPNWIELRRRNVSLAL